MKILMVNKFLFVNGGSEACMFDSARWLEELGHEVVFLGMADPRNVPLGNRTFLMSHVDLNAALSPRGVVRAAARVLWSREALRLATQVVREEKPDVVHLHNMYHQISPSVLLPLRRNGVPTVMTMHDYKVVCPVYTLFRGGRPCEACSGGRFYRCLWYRCCRRSFAKSLLSTGEMYLHQRLLHAYQHVSLYLAPSLFLARQVRAMGFRGSVRYLPNAVDAEALSPSPEADGQGVVFFGRLTEDKGVATLLEALRQVRVPCTIVGEGPYEGALRQRAAALSLENVRFLGRLPFPAALEEVRRASAVVVPSLWYENAPRSVLEAFALAKPVLASRIGGLPEMVRDGETGLTFEPGNSADMARAIRALMGNPEQAARMGRTARRLVETTYSKERHVGKLLRVYQQVMGRT